MHHPPPHHRRVVRMQSELVCNRFPVLQNRTRIHATTSRNTEMRRSAFVDKTIQQATHAQPDDRVAELPRATGFMPASARTRARAADPYTETREADLTCRDLRQLSSLRLACSFGRHACACDCREAHTRTTHLTREPLDASRCGADEHRSARAHASRVMAALPTTAMLITPAAPCSNSSPRQRATCLSVRAWALQNTRR